MKGSGRRLSKNISLKINKFNKYRANKRNIIVSIPLVWGIRNIILSGINKELESKYNIYYCIPIEGKSSLEKYGVDPKNIIINKPVRKNYTLKWLTYILREIHNRLYPTKSRKIFAELVTDQNTNASLLKIIQRLIEKIVIYISTNKLLFNLLIKFEGRYFDKKIDSNFILTIKSLNPIFGFSTSSVVEMEWTLLRSLKKLKVPIFAHILSFDNITSRGYVPIDYFDKYLVWNESMKAELIKYYSISPDRVIITGTPQFDFHRNPKYYLTENDVKAKLGIDTRPYILYCANHHKLTPYEPELLKTIIDLFSNDEYLKDFIFVVRLHPMDDYSRWDNLFARHGNIRKNIPWEHKELQPVFWGEPTLEDLILYGNILRYAKVVLNIASTVVIDAAITDTPAICIGFHPNNAVESKKYYDYHFTDHFESITQIGSAPLAKDEKQLKQLTKESLFDTSYLQDNRRRLASEYLEESSTGYPTNKIADILNEFC